jgi:hypothetical protein
MAGKFFAQLRQQWMGGLALLLVLTGGTAYAANTVFSTDIVDGEVKGPDIASNAVGTGKIGNNQVFPADVRDDTLPDGGLTAADLATDSVDSDEVVDFGLQNQDVGVLFAEVNADSTLANSSGGVTTAKLAGAGGYSVDFGRNVATCAAVATIGPAGTNSAAGEVNVADRFSDVEAVFVDTNTSRGISADLPFRLVVVC